MPALRSRRTAKTAWRAARADAVRDYLDARGVDASRVSVAHASATHRAATMRGQRPTRRHRDSRRLPLSRHPAATFDAERRVRSRSRVEGERRLECRSRRNWLRVSQECAAMDRNADVMVVGSFVQDHAWLTDRFPETGETRRALGFNTGPGGKGFNQAVACLRQGVPTLFIGAIGDDHLGAIAQRFAEDEGLPCRWQIRRRRADRGVEHRRRSQRRESARRQSRRERASRSRFRATRRPTRSRARSSCCCSSRTISMRCVAALELGTASTGLLRMLNPAPVHPGARCRAARRSATSSRRTKPSSRCCSSASPANASPRRRSPSGRTATCMRSRERSASPPSSSRSAAEGCFVSHDERSDERGDAKAFYRRAAPRKSKQSTRPAPATRFPARSRPRCCALATPVPRCRHACESRRRDVDRDRRHGAGDAAVRRRHARDSADPAGRRSD